MEGRADIPDRISHVKQKGGQIDPGNKRQRYFPADKSSDDEVNAARYQAQAKGCTDAADLFSDEKIPEVKRLYALRTEMFGCGNRIGRGKVKIRDFP